MNPEGMSSIWGRKIQKFKFFRFVIWYNENIMYLLFIKYHVQELATEKNSL